MNNKNTKILISILAVLICLTQNIILIIIVLGGLIALAIFKAKDEDLTIKLMQPALISLMIATFKGVFVLIFSSLYQINYYGFNTRTKFVYDLYKVTYFTNFIGNVALVVFVIMGIVAFSQNKNIYFVGNLANKIYSAFTKKDNIENL